MQFRRRVRWAGAAAAGRLQLHALSEAGCIKVFADTQSGRDADRPDLVACQYLRTGDTLVVPSLDLLARSLQDLITLVGELRRRGVGFRSLREALDTATPGGRPVFHIFAARAEFIRELIVEGTHEVRPGHWSAGLRISPVTVGSLKPAELLVDESPRRPFSKATVVSDHVPRQAATQHEPAAHQM